MWPRDTKRLDTPVRWLVGEWGSRGVAAFWERRGDGYKESTQKPESAGPVVQAV